MKNNTRSHKPKEVSVSPKKTEVCCSHLFCCTKFKLVHGVIIVLVIVAAFLLTRILNENKLTKFRTTTVPNTVKKLLNSADAKFTIGKLKETNGVYEFELSLGEGNNVQKYMSYISKDGKLFFTQGVKLDEKEKTNDTQKADQPKKVSCNDVQKVEKPTLTAFVVADCPFGLQMQRVFKKVLQEQPLLGNNLIIRYIGSVSEGKITSMHGDKEAQENLAQICIREEQKEKYWDYISCYIQEGKSEDCLAQIGVNTTALNACKEDKNKGLKYAQADFDLANKFKVTGSPTLLVNEKQIVSEFDYGGRVANSVQQIVCCGSSTKADYCSKELSKTEIATAYSKTDEPAAQSGSTNTAAGCATQ